MTKEFRRGEIINRRWGGGANSYAQDRTPSGTSRSPRLGDEGANVCPSLTAGSYPARPTKPAVDAGPFGARPTLPPESRLISYPPRR